MRLLLAIWLCAAAVAAPPLFRAQNVPGGGFLPSDLPDLALWLDADDASTLTLSGSVVDEWRDKSGNGRNFAGSGSARPALVSAAYNGRDAIQFDGVNDVLTLGASGLVRNVDGLTMYAVYRWDVRVNPGGAVFDIIGPTARRQILQINGAATFAAGGQGRRLDGDTIQTYGGGVLAPYLDFGVHANVVRYADAIAEVYVDGVAGTVTNPFQTAGFTSDTDSSASRIAFNGGAYIALTLTEILVYHAAHDASTRAVVEAYLTR